MTMLLGEKIRSLRKRRGMTLDTLALLADMSKSYLWKLETNHRSPRLSAEKLLALAKALWIDVGYFLEEDVEEPQPCHVDKTFFQKYAQLDPATKEQMRKILDIFASSHALK